VSANRVTFFDGEAPLSRAAGIGQFAGGRVASGG
jgi:hypothetical protein